MSDDNVVMFTGITKLGHDPNLMLKAALDKLTDVVIIGYDKDGDEYFAASMSSGPEVVWMLERAKHRLMKIVDADTGND